jgi:hypothetical protein
MYVKMEKNETLMQILSAYNFEFDTLLQAKNSIEKGYQCIYPPPPSPSGETCVSILNFAGGAGLVCAIHNCSSKAEHCYI